MLRYSGIKTPTLILVLSSSIALSLGSIGCADRQCENAHETGPDYFGCTCETGYHWSRTQDACVTGDGPVPETIYAFTGGDDGGAPTSAVIYNDPELFGYSSGGAGGGKLFFITENGTHLANKTYTFSMSPSGPEGYMPMGSPMLAWRDGLFYGTSYYGGSSNKGALWRYDATSGTMDDAFTIPFVGTNGAYPDTALRSPFQSKELYGVTSDGGNGDCGTVFKIGENGTFQTIYHFSPKDEDDRNTDGCNPTGPLGMSIIFDTDSLYGVTRNGGAHGKGTVFRLTKSGVLISNSTYHFGSSSSDADGSHPWGGILSARADGGPYFGVTQHGGTHGHGTIFQYSSYGLLHYVHSFNGADGSEPNGELVADPDGDFVWGTTRYGGKYDKGVLFKYSFEGDFTVVYHFTGGEDGGSPFGGLTLKEEHRDIRLYGTCSFGGKHGSGTVWQVEL